MVDLPSNSSPSSSASSGPEPRGTVLVAHADGELLKYIVQTLEEAYRVLTAANGGAALALISETPPDVILGDPALLGMNGLGLLKALRSNADTRNIPVILLTSDEDAGDSLADDYLSQPLVRRDLLARVRLQFELVRARKEATFTQKLARQRDSEREQLASALAREREARQTAELLNQLGPLLLAERDTQRLTQRVTDLATQLTGAEFGALFHNVLDSSGGSYMLYTLSGVPHEAFEQFPMPRNTAVFAPTFTGEAIVRSDDITKDPRYGKNAPYKGMPPGHLPVRSYLAAPVISRSGEVLGGLFFGHSKVGVFTEQHEDLARGIAAQAAIALDNARLFTEAQQTRERYEFLAESIPQMVWTADSDGRLDYVNQKAVNYLGSADAITGMRWVHSVHKDDREHALERWNHALGTGEIYEVALRLKRALDGDYRWHLARALPMNGPDGAIIKWFGTCTDIEDQKRVESQLRRANQDLEQFAYSASHDLQEPLRQVATFSQMIQRNYRGRLDERADEFIDYTVQGALRMENLVRDLLAYTQAAKITEAAAAPANVKAAVDDACQNLKMSIQENQAEVEAGSLPAVRVHHVQLVQLFQNLIGNAIKYRGKDAPRIRISVEREGVRWRFCVMDNGIGIAPRYHSQIFGLFKRLHGGAQYTGTGIGLAICQKIVEQYGGRIWVESALGEGAKFYFTLPASGS
jgi:PAS domain S-box-containing protein